MAYTKSYTHDLTPNYFKLYSRSLYCFQKSALR
ncbi:hypothetical protein SAMN04490192_2504 [Pseudomonas lundensis]|nr:hypothetical protein SAMN04490192_2504 [Pseudomonas lundensis]